MRDALALPGVKWAQRREAGSQVSDKLRTLDHLLICLDLDTENPGKDTGLGPADALRIAGVLSQEILWPQVLHCFRAGDRGR